MFKLFLRANYYYFLSNFDTRENYNFRQSFLKKTKDQPLNCLTLFYSNCFNICHVIFIAKPASFQVLPLNVYDKKYLKWFNFKSC